MLLVVVLPPVVVLPVGVVPGAEVEEAPEPLDDGRVVPLDAPEGADAGEVVLLLPALPVDVGAEVTLVVLPVLEGDRVPEPVATSRKSENHRLTTKRLKNLQLAHCCCCSWRAACWSAAEQDCKQVAPVFKKVSLVQKHVKSVLETAVQ